MIFPLSFAFAFSFSKKQEFLSTDNHLTLRDRRCIELIMKLIRIKYEAWLALSISPRTWLRHDVLQDGSFLLFALALGLSFAKLSGFLATAVHDQWPQRIFLADLYFLDSFWSTSLLYPRRPWPAHKTGKKLIILIVILFPPFARTVFLFLAVLMTHFFPCQTLPRAPNNECCLRVVLR